MAVMQAPGAHWHMVPAPSARGLRVGNVYAHSAQVSPWLTAYNGDTSARGGTLRALYSRACAGEKRAA